MAMQCPRDKTSLVEKRYEANIMVDMCPECGGMWLDDGELRAIQETREHDYSAELEKVPGMLAHVSLSKAAAFQLVQPSGSCPKCGSELVSDEYAYCSQVVIDVCPHGCGQWLDKGETQALEVFFERARREMRNDVTDVVDAALIKLEVFWLSLRNGFMRKKKSAPTP